MFGELREDWEAIKMFGLPKVLYWRFIYRHHMRFIHKRGRHQMKHYGPLDPTNAQFDKCEWCGHIENIVPGRTPLWDKIGTENMIAQGAKKAS
jgi:hypothetical protein